MTKHDEDVYTFLKNKEKEDPEQFKTICDRYPVLTPQKWRAIRRREITVGLNVEDHPCKGEQDD